MFWRPGSCVCFGGALVPASTKTRGLLPRKLYNLSPENQWMEDVFPIEIVPFKGKC